MNKYIRPAINYFSNHAYLSLSIILFFAAVLRLFYLDNQSFWHDEILSIETARMPFSQIWQESFIATNIPPLYYLMIKPFLGLPNQEFMLRLPSVLLAVASIFLLYLIIKQIFSEHTALISSLLFATSTFHVWYAQETRPYGPLIFLGLLSFWFLMRCLKKNAGRGNKIGFVFVTASIFYCHTIGIAFIGFLFLAALIWAPREKWPQWIGIFALVGILISPALIELLNMPAMRSADSYRTFNVLALPYTFWVFIVGYSLGPSVTELHTKQSNELVLGSLDVIVPICLFFAIISILALINLKKNSTRLFVTLLLWISCPVIFGVIGSLFSNQPFNARYVILAYPGFMLLWALGIAIIPKTKWRVVALLVIVCVNLVSLQNHYFDDRYHKEAGREAGAYFLQHAKQDDFVVTSAFYVQKDILYYSNFPEEQIYGYRPDKRETNAQIIEKSLAGVLGGHDRFWLYLSRNFNKKQVEIIQNYCDRNYQRKLTKAFNGIELALFERDVAINTTN